MTLVVISPYAKVNFVDHQLTDQTSIIQFIEEVRTNQIQFFNGPSLDEYQRPHVVTISYFVRPIINAFYKVINAIFNMDIKI